MEQKKEFTFHSVGFIESNAKYRYELPRQAVFASSPAFLRWNDRKYAECAADLKGFDRIWLLWVFDRNQNNNYHTRVRVPVPAEKDTYSVFATRSPYRPNPIGMSAVELVDVTPEGLQIGACDLLDGTAVLDVKPYIPEADAFPEAKAGWRDEVNKSAFEINWTSDAAKQADFIFEHGDFDLRNFCDVQLKYRPTDSSRKRVGKIENSDNYLLHFRTWNIIFSCDDINLKINILGISSNYSDSDLAPGTPDPYNDKDLHRSFNLSFQNDKFF